MPWRKSLWKTISEDGWSRVQGASQRALLRIDVARSLRRIRPRALSSAIGATHWSDGATAISSSRRTCRSSVPSLLLDTVVYIDVLQGVRPPEVAALLEHRNINHLSVALGELSHNFGRLDPAHPATAPAIRELRELIADVPEHRVDTATPGTVIEAGILAGLLFRLAPLQSGLEFAVLNDGTIYLHALERGYAVLTRNIRDFDFLNQIVPAGHVVFYRRID
jgi:predicted nucleic acid-binding protein